MEDNNAFGFKIVLLGESGVGKTCIIDSFQKDKFDPNKMTSISATFIRRNIKLENSKEITLNIWDTAGQELFKSLSQIYYKDADAAILVFDITTRISYDALKDYWYSNIKENSKPNISKLKLIKLIFFKI